MSRWSDFRDGAKRRLEALKHPAPGADPDPDNKTLWAKFPVRLAALSVVIFVVWLVLGGIMNRMTLAAHGQVSVNSPALLASMPAWAWLFSIAGPTMFGIFEYRLKKHSGVEKPLRAARWWFIAAGGVLLLWIFSSTGINLSPWLIVVVVLVCLAAWFFSPAKHRLNLGWATLLSASMLSLSLVPAPDATSRPVTQVESNSCAVADLKACQLLKTDLVTKATAPDRSVQDLCSIRKDEVDKNPTRYAGDPLADRLKKMCDNVLPGIPDNDKAIGANADAMLQGIQHNAAASATTAPPPTK